MKTGAIAAILIAIVATAAGAIVLNDQINHNGSPATAPEATDPNNTDPDNSGTMESSVNTVIITSLLSMTYTGEVASTPTYTVLDNAKSIGQWYDSTGTNAIDAPSAIGSYIYRITVEDSENYKGTIYNATFTICEKLEQNYKITYKSGTENAFTVTDDGYGGVTITFTKVDAKSEYSISGTVIGNIVIDCGDDYKFTLNIEGLTLTSEHNTPVAILSGDEVSLSVKKSTVSYVYDKRETVSDDDTTQYSAAIYSIVDLELKGKGTLNVISENNNGIRTKDDLQVKNLTLNVTCEDNALKGNDSVTITSGDITLIARTGDCIKTSNTATKYNDDGSFKKQQGIIAINTDDGDLTLRLYAACDGIDASYNVEISGNPVISIFTDKYSEYSESVTTTSTENVYYIVANSNSYNYSVVYSDGNGKVATVSSTYLKATGNSYAYTFPKLSGYSTISIYIYTSSQKQGQTTDYAGVIENKSINSSYDAIRLSYRGTNVSMAWTNYSMTTSTMPGGMGGPGGMVEGNSDKGDYSTKAIKADNEITISGGSITIQSYDDAIHANGDVLIDYGTTSAYGSGNVTITGGVFSITSNDDGIHADGTLTITGGTVNILTCYEGLEGTNVIIEGGDIDIISKDDGINATATSGTAISVSGGDIYIFASGDGIDSNSKTSKTGLVITGGNIAVFCNSNGNGAIDTEAGYTMTGGHVVAVLSGSQWLRETTEVTTSLSTRTVSSVSLSNGSYLTVNGTNLIAKCQANMSNAYVFCINMGSNAAVSSSTTASITGNSQWSI